MREKIQETKDYGLFRLGDLNRDVRRILPLMESMEAHGFIPAYPLHVTKEEGGSLRIKAGHHRFIAAKSLGLPVKYIVCEDEATIQELEKTSQKWNLEDYLTSYVRAKSPAYLHLEQFKADTDLSIRSCIYLLGHQIYGDASGKKALASFKNGEFKVVNPRRAYWVGQLIKAAEKGHFRGATHYNFVVALSRAVMDGGANFNQLKKQLSTWGHSIRLSSNVEDYVRELERIYNFRNRKKLPLTYLIDEADAMRRRKGESSV